MISVLEAKELIQLHTPTLKPVQLPLSQSPGLVLAADCYAQTDIPAFNQASMDGYAFRFPDQVSGECRLEISGIAAAGNAPLSDLKPGEAVRIFTGAALPVLADTVVMQEWTKLEGNTVVFPDKDLQKGDFVRLKGAEIKKGEWALEKGTRLQAPVIGLLAGIGVAAVTVIPKPRIALVITGNELKQPGEMLDAGEIYDANSFTLKAALQQLQMELAETFFCRDSLSELEWVLAKAIASADLVLVTGGVSVGDYDFVPRAMEINGVSTLFHKIKQKPGKPLYLGKKSNTLLFGLPGNPASVLSCFYEYVIPAIEKMMGITHSCIRKEHLPLVTGVTKKKGLTHFLKARTSAEGVVVLSAQESYRLSAFATANCLVCLEEDKTDYTTGDLVEVHFLPF